MHISLRLCYALKYKDYTLISVYCYIEFWSLSYRLHVWFSYTKAQEFSSKDSFFELGLVGSGLGLWIFLQDEPRDSP